MTVSTIERLENPCKYQLMIDFTIIIHCCCVSWHLPKPLKNIVMVMDEPSLVLMHLVKCIFSQKSAVLFILSQSTWYNYDLHPPFKSESVPYHYAVKILNNFWRFMTLHFESSSGVHRSELLHCQPGWYGSNSLQLNTMSLHHLYPSYTRLLDLQELLNETLLSGIPSRGVNGIHI